MHRAVQEAGRAEAEDWSIRMEAVRDRDLRSSPVLSPQFRARWRRRMFEPHIDGCGFAAMLEVAVPYGERTRQSSAPGKERSDRCIFHPCVRRFPSPI